MTKARTELPASQLEPDKQGVVRPLSAIVYALVLYIVSQVAGSVLLIGVLWVLGWDMQRTLSWLTDSTFAQFLFIVIVEAITIYGVYWLLRRRGLTMKAIGWDRPKLRYLWLMITGFGTYFLGYIVIATVVGMLVPSLDFSQEQEIGFENSRTSLELCMTFISLVVLPPLAEEIVFRGLIFTSLRKRYSFIVTAIVTSVLFAIPHLQFGSDAPLLWVAALDTLVLSLVLCYVREKTGSLWPSILIHALKNGVAFTALFLLN